MVRPMREVETIVVGGGPAGSGCARELVRQGRECLVLERKAMPRVKLCAGWVTPKVLKDLEIQPHDYPHGLVQLGAIKAFFGRRHGHCRTARCEQYSIRRVEFDAWLLSRSGAEVAQHTVRQVVAQPGGYVLDGEFRCRHLVGAGGTNCPVKKALFGDGGGRLVLAQEVEYETAVGNPLCTLWFPYAGSWGYGWYVPKAGAVNIGFGGLRSQLRDWDRKQLWRDFVALLRKEGCIEGPPPEPTGYSYFVGRRRQRVKAGTAYVVGDAAGLATADLAEGIGPAVESGILAARDILGQATYSTRAVTRYSLPLVPRLLRHAAAFVP
jgi:flavin-dependent dehydrogenase